MKKNIEIIAEIAQGFEGDRGQAIQLLKAAASAGADVAKFQLVYADELATTDYKYYDLFKDLEMDDSVWEDIVNIANELQIELVFDIFGVKSLALAQKLKTKRVMLHATDINNLTLLNQVADSNISDVIIGVGGAHLPEIESALKLLKKKFVFIMFGFQGYPTPDEHNQISRISYATALLTKKYKNVITGFADHSDPNSNLLTPLSAMAYAAGARVFEKHLTLSQVMKLEDYESAVNPDQFSTFCFELRECVKAYGEVKDLPDFGMSSSEKKYREFVQRHVVSNRDLARGDIVSESDVRLSRTSNKAAIVDIDRVVGRKLSVNVQKNQTFEDSQLVKL